MTSQNIAGNSQDGAGALGVLRNRVFAKLRARVPLLIPALFYACGVALCLFKGQYLPLESTSVVWWSCIAAFAACVILYNRYTMLCAVALAAVAAATAYFGLKTERLLELVELISENLTYVRGFLFENVPYDEAYEPALFASILVSCGLISALLAFRLRNPLAMAALALGIFMLEWSLSGAVILSALFPAAVACAVMMAARGPKFTFGAPLQAAAMAVVVAASAYGACVIAVPDDTGGVRLTSVERALDNVNDLLSDYTGFQRPHASFSIANIGMQPLGDRLGGAVTLPDAEMLSVSSVAPRYLRGTVRNYYTGYSWSRSASIRTYRLGNPLIMDRQNQIMGVGIPIEGENEALFAREVDMRITHLSEMSNTLFTFGRVREMTDVSAGVITNFDENTEAFSKRPVSSGTSYRVSARVPNTHMAAFPGTVSLYEQEGLMADDHSADERNAFLYLGLPESVPYWVYEESKLVVASAGAVSDFEMAQALCDYLKENFTYTLSPVDPPVDEDFVAFFLESGEGYCTYFASAMAVMARSLGLPSRYVEGFILQGSRYTQSGYVVKADQAHAWAEVYIDGLGWLIFDATPRASTNDTAAAYVPPPEEPVIPEEPYEPEELEELPVRIEGNRLPWWVYPIAGAIALLALFISLLRWHDNRWSTRSLEKKHREPSGRLSVVWRDILRELAMIGCALHPGETPYSYAKRVDATVDNPEGKLRTVAESLVKDRYGGVAPSADDVDYANAYRGELDLRIKESSGRIRFVFTRVLRRMPRA